MSATRTNGYYPICLSLRGRPCLVVGGGRIAQHKINILLQYHGVITVVSPTLTPALRRWATQGRVRYRPRTFRASDVRGMWLVYGATDDTTTQRAIYRAATRARLWVNIVDVPKLCNFIMPSQIRRGGMTIAITTGGRSPGLAKRVRKDLQRVIGPEYGQLLRLLERERSRVRDAVPTVNGRKRVFEQLIYNDDILALLRRGQQREAREQARRLIQRTITHGVSR